MISAPMISLQAQSHRHTITKASAHSVRTAHVADAAVAVAVVAVVVESVVIHSTALRP
jgi:hypothetical protein